MAGYIKQLIQASQLDLKVGLVQTAYANGSSTHYVTQSMVQYHKNQNFGKFFGNPELNF